APPAELSDGQLLQHFIARRDESAFAALLQRHGPLVWGVCRRVLERDSDAEDAFQAVFLVLARRAGTVRWHDDMGNWLYGVANRIARKARSRNLRHAARAGPLRDVAAATDEEADWKELRPVLDEEISRLPEKYRVPIVLCYLQGKTYREAAQLLGWAEGTVSGRLARARELLRGRLLRRGLTPSGALLAALPSRSAEAATPAALSEAVVRAAPAFALTRGVSDGLISGSALALANEVMGSMMLIKWKVASLVLLVLAVAGTSAAVLAPRPQPEKQPQAVPNPVKPPATPKAAAAARPPLKKEWQGKWDADPFLGTTAIEVVHRSQGGPSRTYRINNPNKVATLMKLLTIQAFRNNIAQGNIPAAQLIFHKKDNSFSVNLDSLGSFQCYGGEIYVKPAFLTALNRHLAGPDGQPIDLTTFRPAPPRKKPAPATLPTLDTLKSGFKAFTVQYCRGRKLREAHITDRKMLDELEKSFVVVEHVADKGRKGMRLPSQSFVAVPKAEGNQHWPHGHFLDRQHLFVWDIGRLTVKPSFVRTLNEQLSRLEGRTVDVLGDNKPLPEQIQRERKFRDMLSAARSFRYTEAAGREIVVDRREDVTEFIKALTEMEASVRKWQVEPSNVVIEVTTEKGEKVRLRYYQTGDANEKVGVSPIGSDLVEVAGIGQVWLDRQWRYRFPHYGEQREMAAWEQRDLETRRLVSAELPAFLKQVVNLIVYFREGDDELSQWLSAASSRPILAAMEIEKVEKLDWTKERWQMKMEKLEKRGSGMLELTPGLGFSLAVVFSGPKEMLIPMWGRVHLKNDITAQIRQALEKDPDKSKQIRLLPHGPE
ncbi:MAG: RNA polymerase sigma factor, partial [Gemmataceae bacterium]